MPRTAAAVPRAAAAAAVPRTAAAVPRSRRRIREAASRGGGPGGAPVRPFSGYARRYNFKSSLGFETRKKAGSTCGSKYFE